jgi:hypothetical protein
LKCGYRCSVAFPVRDSRLPKIKYCVISYYLLGSGLKSKNQIQLGLYSLDKDPDWESGFGYRQATKKKVKELHVLKNAGCSLWRAGDFFSLEVFYGGLRINIFQFLINKKTASGLNEYGSETLLFYYKQN